MAALALRAAREAAADRMSLKALSDPRTALIVGTSKGPIQDWMQSKTLYAPATLSDVEDGSFGIAGIAAHVARQLRMTGPRLTLSAACASSLHALIRGVMMIHSGEVDRALIVAAESSLHPLFIGSFKRLGVLPPAGVGCRPFDRARAGFLMSEAAAAVVLEADDQLTADAETGFRVHVERISMAGDASHLTAADPSGLVLRRVLEQVVGCDGVDLVHAHGTGTVSNDPVELSAIESALRASPSRVKPNLYSHKGAIGHSLGGAGLVSVALNCLAHHEGIVPPNVRTTDSIANNAVVLDQASVTRTIRRSVAIAAGFGGACAAVSLESS